MAGRLARLVVGLAALVVLLPAPAAAFRYVDVGRTVPALDVNDAAGRAVRVPAAGRTTLLLFWQPAQRLSEAALADLGALDAAVVRGVDVVAIAASTGERPAERRAVRMLADPDGRAAERYGVIVYPSTALIGADGRLLHYLPSHTPGYRALLAAHLAGARGELSASQLATRVAGLGEDAGTSTAQTAYRRGLALAADGRRDDAAQALGEALRADAALLDARLALANIRLEQNRPADALREFEAALARHPASPAAQVGRGIARLRLGETDEGVRLLEQAIEMNPEPVRAHYELARAYETRGDMARALEHYRAAYTKLRQGRK